ncbi:unnamed protein product [Porites lobata]|uniref:HECT domain-containing protein n=1 Tax=Porites lobata TaxID=104759 RepID=A0ABN8PMH8_9CNID|nr:unnamed protein product [Porites lobata]
MREYHQVQESLFCFWRGRAIIAFPHMIIHGDLQGHIIGHSILHGGSGLHALSPTVKNYLSTDADSDNPPTLKVEDIPTIALRQIVTEDKLLDMLPIDDKPSTDLKTALDPYMLEAGLDPDQLESVMTFHVIDKRRLALDDIIKGMEEVKLHSFLKKYPKLDNLNEEQQRTVEFFKTYIDDVDGVEGGSKLRTLLTFWTGEVHLRQAALSYGSGCLLIKFDQGENNLPMSETCFRSITLHTKHEQYMEFKRNMDIALTYGASGFAFH